MPGKLASPAGRKIRWEEEPCQVESSAADADSQAGDIQFTVSCPAAFHCSGYDCVWQVLPTDEQCLSGYCTVLHQGAMMTIITVTFDNGPDPEVTPLVLKTLRRHDIKSTFFVLGDKLRERRRLAEQANEEGHWIGNHTFNHLMPLGMATSSGIASAEISRTQEMIGDLGHERKFFRPFGGGGLLDKRLLNREALDELRNGHYTCVLWNVIPEDWAYPRDWVDRALDLCFAEEHAVMVLHDLSTGAMDRLDRFIGAATDRGAVFRQDFASDCVPIERGLPVRPLDHYLSDAEMDLEPESGGETW